MKKRLLCLLMALIMVLPLMLTSCSSSESGKEGASETGESLDESSRQNIILTIYGVTADSTTEEAIAAVEKKVSEYCVAKYKTAIDLRLFKESEYEKALNDVYAKFKEEEKKAAEEAAAKAEADKAERERVKNMTTEQKAKYAQEQRIKKKEEEAQALKEAKEKAALVEEGRDVAELKEVQMDIIYIPDYKTYQSNVTNGLLTDINSYLTGRYKDVMSFVYPAYICGANMNGGVYGLPINDCVSGDETCFVVNKELASKYGVDFSKIQKITDLEPYFEQIKANEKGVTCISGDFAPEGIEFLNLPGTKTAGIAASFKAETFVGGKFTAEGLSRTYSTKAEDIKEAMDYFALKAKYRTNGYLGESNNFFVSIRTLDENGKAALRNEGYDVYVYQGAEFTTDDVFANGLFGISSKCTEPARAMEVLKLLYTDAEFHDIFTYGLQDVNYVLETTDEGIDIVKRVNDTYVMDTKKTGNALIGHTLSVEEYNRVQIAKEKNVNSRLSPTLGIYVDDGSEDAKKLIEAFDYWNNKFAPQIAKLMNGTNDYAALVKEIAAGMNDKTAPYTYATAVESNKRFPKINDNAKRVADFAKSFQ